eukprot:9118802-Pyramimonas_sp.AAC.1
MSSGSAWHGKSSTSARSAPASRDPGAPWTSGARPAEGGSAARCPLGAASGGGALAAGAFSSSEESRLVGEDPAGS